MINLKKAELLATRFKEHDMKNLRSKATTVIWNADMF